MKVIILAVAMLAFTGSAFAVPTHTAPYLDAKGKCHQANGHFAAASVCHAPAPVAAAATRCRDKTTKRFVKCGSPNSEPVPAH